MRCRTIAAPLLLLGALGAPPAAAVETELGVRGTISVYADLGACGTLTFPRPTIAAGSFTAAGAVAGPGTATAPVRGVTAVVVTQATSWYGCLPDAYAGASVGHAVYQLSVSGADGDYASVLSCDVWSGWVTCR
ncbi:MAG TPA: hypothetical protein VNA20_02000 [Frankiaceae bacterium]|nr:hypothetical protein [Frankiaceae bacterium]